MELCGLARELGWESIATFVKRDLRAEEPGLGRQMAHKVMLATGEAQRLLREIGTLRCGWTVLEPLAVETKRQRSGCGQLRSCEFAEVSREVAEG